MVHLSVTETEVPICVSKCLRAAGTVLKKEDLYSVKALAADGFHHVSCDHLCTLLRADKIYDFVLRQICDCLVERNEIVNSQRVGRDGLDRKSTRLNSSHSSISYAVFCLKKK